MKQKFLLAFISLSICSIINAQTIVPCPNCGGYGIIATYYGNMYCPVCGGTGGVVVSNSGGNNVSFQGNSNQSDGYEFLRDVVFYSYNSNTQIYERHSVHKLYKYWTGSQHILYVDKNARVITCSYPRSKDFQYCVAGPYGIYYYFN